MKAISLDLGGSHVTIAIVEDDKVLMSEEISVDDGGELLPLLPRFKTIVDDRRAREAAHPSRRLHRCRHGLRCHGRSIQGTRPFYQRKI